ncbi:MAG: dCMP deaminase family protein [Elusimicrobia bacterium]|nr:dCMP deaminase family protein [Elusimicrobiota bacterium]
MKGRRTRRLPGVAERLRRDGRITKDQYYLNIAKETGRRSTCLRRHYGAVIVNNDQIVSTGYAGAPRKMANCTEIGTCIRIKLNVPKGEHYEWCRAVHAEQNAIIHASRFDMIGATLYLVGVAADDGEVIEGAAPCRICKRMIINAGIKRVIIQTAPGRHEVQEVERWIRSNLHELRRVRGRVVPIMPKGY